MQKRTRDIRVEPNIPGFEIIKKQLPYLKRND